MSAALKREHFSINRATEYFRITELQAQTGQPESEFGHVILKELVDNGLDAAETAGVAPEVAIEWLDFGDRIKLTVSDNGPGIPEHVVERILDFQTRTSDKAAYRSPTRGALGNAWKTFVGIPFALGDERTVIEIKGAGLRHRLAVWITPAGEVKHEHTREKGPEGGASVTLSFPRPIAWEPTTWAKRFAAFNPHAQIKIRKICADIKLDKSDAAFWDFLSEPTPDPKWRKFYPTDPTPPHWYSTKEFSALTHLKAAADPFCRLSTYVSEFKGLSSRYRAVVDGRPETLEELVESEEEIAELHAAMMEEAKAPQPEVLGRVGPEHFRAVIEASFGIRGDRFWYKHRFGVTDNGMPFLVEAGIAETKEIGTLWCGLNFSAPFGSDPLSSRTLIGRGSIGNGLISFLADSGVYNSVESLERRELKSAALVHIVMPLLPSLDRGKSNIALPLEVANAVADVVSAAAKTLGEEDRRWRKRQYRELVEEDKESRAARASQWSKAGAVKSILLDIYMRETDGERLHISVRDLFYAVRPVYAEMDVRSSRDRRGRETRELGFNYFSQTIIPEFQSEIHPLEMIDYKARGSLYLPHSGKELIIGDKELRELDFPDLEVNKLLFVEKDGIWQTLRQTGGIELAKRHDMAILAGQGYATVAMRRLVQIASERNWQVFAWHDADISGYDIIRTLAEETRRMPDHRIDVYDIGLKVADALQMGLQSEAFTRRKSIPDALLPKLTTAEFRLFEGEKASIGQGEFAWQCERFEINAIPIRERVPYLERKLAEIPDLLGKVVPPVERFPKIAQSILEGRILEMVRDEIERRLNPDEIAEAAITKLVIPEAWDERLPDALSTALLATPEETWRETLSRILEAKAPGDDEIVSAVDAAINENLN